MRQVLGPSVLGRPRGIGWRGRWEVGLGWGIHVYPWLIHVNVWQKPLQYCKVISLQLIKKIKIKINEPDKSNTQSCFKDEMKKKILECHEMEDVILLYVILNKIWLNNFEYGVTLTKFDYTWKLKPPSSPWSLTFLWFLEKQESSCGPCHMSCCQRHVIRAPISLTSPAMYS